MHRRPPRRGVAAPPRPSTHPSASPRTRLSATFRGSALTGSPPSAPSSLTTWPSLQRRRAPLVPLAPLAPPYPRLSTVATAAETALQRRASARRRQSSLSTCPVTCRGRAPSRAPITALRACPRPLPRLDSSAASLPRGASAASSERRADVRAEANIPEGAAPPSNMPREVRPPPFTRDFTRDDADTVHPRAPSPPPPRFPFLPAARTCPQQSHPQTRSFLYHFIISHATVIFYYYFEFIVILANPLHKLDNTWGIDSPPAPRRKCLGAWSQGSGVL